MEKILEALRCCLIKCAGKCVYTIYLAELISLSNAFCVYTGELCGVVSTKQVSCVYTVKLSGGKNNLCIYRVVLQAQGCMRILKVSSVRKSDSTSSSSWISSHSSPFAKKHSITIMLV